MNNSDFSPEAHAPAISFITIGCRLNRAETEAVSTHFSELGWNVVGVRDSADVVYINTCTVTGKADRSSRQVIHRARRNNPDALILAVGCFAKAAASELSENGEVDIILGVREKSRPLDYIPKDLVRPERPIVAVDDDGPIHAAVGTLEQNRARASLKVQDGCNHSCAYCAVTLVRGSSVSAPFDEIRAKMHDVKDAGFEELVLTGVDLTAWGRDFPGETRDYVDLVELAAEMDIPRVRISSLEPWELTPERIERLASIPNWCEHFHVSLQSADPGVLVRMNRPTDLGKLRESIAELLRKRPFATVGADIIVGFPGESEKAFERSLLFLDEGPLHYLHVFPFSPRPGTLAATLDGQIDRNTLQQRAERLRKEAQIRRLQHLHQAIGRQEEVLVEHDGVTGYTRGFLRTTISEGGPQPARRRTNVMITGVDKEEQRLYAKVLS